MISVYGLPERVINGREVTAQELATDLRSKGKKLIEREDNPDSPFKYLTPEGGPGNNKKSILRT